MRITSSAPIHALLLSSPRAATLRTGEARTADDGTALVGAFFMLLGPRPLRRWVEWPGTPSQVAQPVSVLLHGLTVSMYDRRDGQPGLSLTAARVEAAR